MKVNVVFVLFYQIWWTNEKDMYARDPLEEWMGHHHPKSSPHQSNLVVCFPPWILWSWHWGYQTSPWHHKIFPENNMGLGNLWLYITTCYCKNLAMFVFVYVTRHNSPILQVLHMIKHDPWIFHVSSTLHELHQIDSASSKILNTKTFSFDCLGIWPSCTYFNPKWFFNAMMLSKEPIPLQMKRFEPATKFLQLGEAKVENLSITTSKDAPWRWFFSPRRRDLRILCTKNCLLAAITIFEFFAIGV
jgi:hypothetical protein